MISKRCSLGLALVFLTTTAVMAAPPTEPESLKIYNHDKEWLSHFPTPFIASNIRGEGLQYKERRIAALDLVREKRDFSVVSELMTEVSRKSFLSADICELLGDWGAKRAVPLLQKLEGDPTRPKEVREKAAAALKKIAAQKPTAPPVFNYPS